MPHHKLVCLDAPNSTSEVSHGSRGALHGHPFPLPAAQPNSPQSILAATAAMAHMENQEWENTYS